MRREWARLRAAFMFLTRIPVPHADLTAANFAGAVRYYPLVGLALGTLAAGGFAVGQVIGGPVVAALFALAVTLLATGAFHEDGLADLFDGMGAMTPERALEIMRDSRLGTFGAVALFVALGLKLTALATLPYGLVLLTLPAAHALSRLSAVMVIATSRYARAEGAAATLAEGKSASNVTVALLIGLAIAAAYLLLASAGATLAVLIGAVAGHVLARLFFERRLGGYTGDCLGAVQQISEICIYLALLAWL